MSFPRLRPPGLWTFDTVVDPEEFEAFDANIANALDGLNGGVYALLDDLEIGGTGAFLVSTSAEFSGGFTEFTGSVGFDDDVTFSASSPVLFLGTVGFGNDVDFSGGTVTLGASGSDAIVVDGFFQVNETSNFNAGVFFNDEVAFDAVVGFNAYAQFNDSVGFDDDVTFGDVTIFSELATFDDVLIGGVLTMGAAVVGAPMTFTGTGKVLSRTVAGSDGATTYQAANVDNVFVAPGTLSASQNYTIGDTGAENGMRIRFVNEDPTHTIFVKHPGGSGLDSIGGSATKVWGEYERISGAWRRVGVGPVADT